MSGNENLPSIRTIQRSLRGLVEAGWLISEYIRGSKRPYSVRITNYVCVADGDAEQKVVNPRETKGWTDTNINRGADRDADRTLTGANTVADRAASTSDSIPDSLDSSDSKRESKREKTVDDDGGAIPKPSPDKPSGTINLSDDEIYREYKGLFDDLVRKYEAWSAVDPRERKRLNLPEGKAFENPLRANVDHRRKAADLYRAIGQEAALAKWADFLVNYDHTATERVADINEDGNPTGKFVSVEVERTWLLHDFVLAHGLSSSEPSTEGAKL